MFRNAWPWKHHDPSQESTRRNIGVPKGGGGGGRGVQNPPSEIPKALQNRAKLDPIVKTVKNCWI